MLMLLLCGCRTRLTNNTDVNATISDEDGILTGNYEARREELGSPVAEKPIFTGFSSDDDEDIDYGDTDTLDPYDPYQDDGWDEPDDVTGDDTGDTSGGSTSTGTTTKKPTTTTTKRKSTTTTTTSDKIKITLNLNDGNNTKNSLTVKKNTAYKDFLPSEALRDGYEFVEWTTDKANKKPVNLSSKATKDQTLYAHWKKKADTTGDKTDTTTDYKITWEYDSDVTVADADSLPSATKDGKYPDTLPTAHKKNYHFLGWDNGSGLITAGQDCTGDSRLVAKFDSWEKIYNDAKPDDTALAAATFAADSGLDELARGTAWADTEEASEAGPAYVIIKFEGDEFTEEAAKAAAAAKRAETVPSGEGATAPYADSIIIVVPKDAAGKKNALYYQLLIHNTMYGGLDLDKADEDTEASSTLYYVDGLEDPSL